jgi:CO/xanthine dehydrogenase Mo-binding subunit
MILAETREQAVSAAELIESEYPEETPVGILADGEAHAHDLQLLFGLFPASYTRGDIQAGLAQAEVRVDASYSYPAHRHHPIELSSTTAVWDGPRLTVYETTQGVSMTQINLCDLPGLEPQNVRVVSRFLGGGFGVKGTFWPHTALTALAVGGAAELKTKTAAGVSCYNGLPLCRDVNVAHSRSVRPVAELAGCPLEPFSAPPHLLSVATGCARYAP